MLYTVIFAGLAILVVVAVLVRSLRNNADRDSSKDPAGTNTPSRTPRGSSARKERKRRRQSRNDRRKRH